MFVPWISSPGLLTVITGNDPVLETAVEVAVAVNTGM